jgi:hypothetical protein
MSKWGHLGTLVRVGSVILFSGCVLISMLKGTSSGWQLFAYLVPANFGQGLAYPSTLFSMLAKYDQSRTPSGRYSHSEQAVTTSSIYLFRNLGSVWGIAAVYSLLQTLLSTRLSSALEGVENKNEVWRFEAFLTADIRRAPPCSHLYKKHRGCRPAPENHLCLCLKSSLVLYPQCGVRRTRDACGNIYNWKGVDQEEAPSRE